MRRREFLARTAQAAVGAVVVTSLGHAQSGRPIGGDEKKLATPVTSGGDVVVLSVRDQPFGATGDGTTKDTTAFQAALDRCAALGGGEVMVPPGRYLIGSVQLRSHTVLRLTEGAELVGSPDMADYAVTVVRWEGRWIPGHIGLVNAVDATEVGVVGPGRITGCDAIGGRPTKEAPLRHPAVMEFLRCDGVHLKGFSTSYFHMWSIHPTSCRNVVIEGLTIRSTGGNGDGIDIDSCQQVKITHCDISTGDDCISLKSGRGLEAYTMRQPTEDVVIADCTFADSLFACIGIGSENSAGIRRVRIERCRFVGAKSHAIYIKSRVGRGALLEDITAEDLDVEGMQAGFLRLNLLNSGLLGEDPVPGFAGIPEGRRFVFRNVRVKDVPLLVKGTEMHPEKPLDGLVLENISGTCKRGMILAHMRNVVLKNITVTGYEGPLLATVNVTGTGLEAAVPGEAPKLPEPIVADTVPYMLH